MKDDVGGGGGVGVGARLFYLMLFLVLFYQMLINSNIISLSLLFEFLPREFSFQQQVGVNCNTFSNKKKS